MKKSSLLLTLIVLLVASSFACCGKGGSVEAEPIPGDTIPNHSTDTTGHMIKIKAGERTFDVLLENNETARAFKAMLPLTLDMAELNANEKYAELSRALPMNASNPGNIKAGDLMLYGSRTLVLFYKSFPTSYNYTKIGHIANTTSLVESLGSTNVQVRFE